MPAGRELRRTWGNLLETTMDNFGKHVVIYDGIPVFVGDFVSDAQTQGTSSTGSSGIAVLVGMKGVMGVQNGELPVIDRVTTANRHEP